VVPNQRPLGRHPPPDVGTGRPKDGVFIHGRRPCLRAEVRYSTQAWLSAAGIKSTRKRKTAMTTQVFDKIYKIELPIPFQLKTTNVFFVDEPPRTLVDTGIKTEASFEALKKGWKQSVSALNRSNGFLSLMVISITLVKLKNYPLSLVHPFISILKNMAGSGRSSIS
jgi:hypothetical protein